LELFKKSVVGRNLAQGLLNGCLVVMQCERIVHRWLTQTGCDCVYHVNHLGVMFMWLNYCWFFVTVCLNKWLVIMSGDAFVSPHSFFMVRLDQGLPW